MIAHEARRPLLTSLGGVARPYPRGLACAGDSTPYVVGSRDHARVALAVIMVPVSYRLLQRLLLHRCVRLFHQLLHRSAIDLNDMP